MEEMKSPCNLVYEGIPPLSADYAWLICQNLEGDNNDKDVQSFHPIHDRPSHCRCPIKCRIPELVRRGIQGYYHGWLILSSHPKNDLWFLWNPVTSEFISLPPLPYEDGDSHDIGDCCLLSPPHDPNSILLVYAMGIGIAFIIHIDIVVKEKEVVINLSPLPEYPFPDCNGALNLKFVGHKGTSNELFFILAYFDVLAKDTLDVVYLFKLDMTSTTSKWEEIDYLKDAIFFVNFYDWSIYYNPAIASELGGCVHIVADYARVIHYYHVKNKTVYLSYLPYPDLAKVHHMWECRLEGDYEEAKRTYHKEKVVNDDEIVIKQITDNVVESSNMTNESHLLDIPFHLLEMIMKFCVGVEYLNFRATCKHCHLAAPLIQWRSKIAFNKLQTYSLVSLWLMVLEDNRGIMHFTDPLFGDKYFMKTLPVSINSNTQICCSSYGWLLFYNNLGQLVFFNPFTSDVRELPTAGLLLEKICFSAPPTSSKCIVLGFTTPDERSVYVLKFGDPDPLWDIIDLDFDGDDPSAFYFPTFFGQDVYALCDEGNLSFSKRSRAKRISIGKMWLMPQYVVRKFVDNIF